MLEPLIRERYRKEDPTYTFHTLISEARKIREALANYSVDITNPKRRGLDHTEVYEIPQIKMHYRISKKERVGGRPNIEIDFSVPPGHDEEVEQIRRILTDHGFSPTDINQQTSRPAVDLKIEDGPPTHGLLAQANEDLKEGRISTHKRGELPGM